MATPEGGLQHYIAVLGAVSGVSPTNTATHFEVSSSKQARFKFSSLPVLLPRVSVHKRLPEKFFAVGNEHMPRKICSETRSAAVTAACQQLARCLPFCSGVTSVTLSSSALQNSSRPRSSVWKRLDRLVLTHRSFRRSPKSLAGGS